MADSVKTRWDRLNSKRNGVLAKARECSELTIPSILPPEGHTEDNPLPTPFQGLGARGTNNLASKLQLAIMPVNQIFYKLEPDATVLAEYEKQDPEARSKSQKRLSKLEQQILSYIEGQNYRPALYEVLRHLIVTGNSLVFIDSDAQMKVYRLDQYVVRRDRSGNVMETIIKEMVDPETLPEATVRACQIDTSKENTPDCEVYTRVHRRGNKFYVYQEINEIRVPKSEGNYPLDKPAFLPLRWSAIPGENYGRGLVEEYLGDLRSLEGATKSIIEFAANAAKIVWLVNPNGLTRASDLSQAESGEFVNGREGDVSMLGLDKFPDFRIVSEVAETLSRRLHQAFLLNASVQRDAERVTAAEVQLMARELEDALGGVYSVLSQEFQLPFIRRVMAVMQKKGELPILPEDLVKTKITTGLEALGRGHDLQKLMRLMEVWKAIPPEILMKELNFRDFMRRTAAAEGVDTEGLIIEQNQQNQQQNMEMMRQMIQDTVPGMLQELMKQNGGTPPNG